jgi:micrococcal nuclease
MMNVFLTGISPMLNELAQRYSRHFAVSFAKSIIVLAGFVSAPGAFSETTKPANWSGTVVYVVDGDTVHVRPAAGGRPVKIRMHGIDAPETCQAGGDEARAQLARRLMHRAVSVNGKQRDDYGRLLAQLTENGEDINGWMVARGWAWSYRFHRSLGPYGEKQTQAKAARRGVFATAAGLPPAVYPGDFRKQHGSCRHAPTWK